MSTAARKAFKRAAQEERDMGGTDFGGLHATKTFIDGVWAAKRRKTGTPVPDRHLNGVYLHEAPGGKIVNSTSARGRRRVAEYSARTHAATAGTQWPDYRRASRA